jgi:hypothetical protein
VNFNSEIADEWAQPISRHAPRRCSSLKLLLGQRVARPDSCLARAAPDRAPHGTPRPTTSRRSPARQRHLALVPRPDRRLARRRRPDSSRPDHRDPKPRRPDRARRHRTRRRPSPSPRR